MRLLLREGLGGAAEDRDVPQAELERPVEPALVGHQHRQVATAVGAEPGHQLLGVGELRHPLRVHEAGRLDDRQPGGDQPAYELRLDVGGHDRLLVLQAVARADLVDRDPLGQPRIAPASAPAHHVRHQRPPRRRTAWHPAPPGRRPRRRPAVTVPANGAFSASSIFIASRTPSTSPSVDRAGPRRPGRRARCRASARAGAVADGRPRSPITSGRSKTNRCPCRATSAVCGCTLTTALTRRPSTSRVSTWSARPARGRRTKPCRSSTRPAARSTTTGSSELDALGAGAAAEPEPVGLRTGARCRSSAVNTPGSRPTRIARQRRRRARARGRVVRGRARPCRWSASRNASLAASARRKPALVVSPRIAVSSRARDQGLPGALAVRAVRDHLAEHRVVRRGHHLAALQGVVDARVRRPPHDRRRVPACGRKPPKESSA